MIAFEICHPLSAPHPEGSGSGSASLLATYSSFGWTSVTPVPSDQLAYRNVFQSSTFSLSYSQPPYPHRSVSVIRDTGPSTAAGRPRYITALYSYSSVFTTSPGPPVLLQRRTGFFSDWFCFRSVLFRLTSGSYSRDRYSPGSSPVTRG